MNKNTTTESKGKEVQVKNEDPNLIPKKRKWIDVYLDFKFGFMCVLHFNRITMHYNNMELNNLKYSVFYKIWCDVYYN